MILVDSNVVLDIFEPKSPWSTWSLQALASTRGMTVFVNPVVVAEVGTRFDDLEKLEAALSRLSLVVLEMTVYSSWLAGRAHISWIRNGGRRGAMLADILIGAHARAENASVLTRDPRRFRTYFPELELITPESTND